MSSELEEIDELALTDDESEPQSVLKLAKTIKTNRNLGDDDEDDDIDEDGDGDGDDDDDDDDAATKTKKKRRNSADSDDDEDEAVDEDEDDEDDDDDEDNDESDSEAKETRGTTSIEQRLFPGLDLDNDDEEAEEDEHYLQKFDDSMTADILSKFYPELQSHNFEEVDSMARIVRDPNGLIIDPFHKTLPFITKYEKSRILGERAKQLNSGAKAMVELDEHMIDGYLIALKEYDEKKIPFIIKRPLPNGACEYWRFSDMEILA